MGKERLIESARQGLKSTAEFVKTKPAKATVLGISGLAGAVNGSGLGLSVVYGNDAYIIINSLLLVVNAGTAVGALILKNSKSVDQQSRPQNSPEP